MMEKLYKLRKRAIIIGFIGFAFLFTSLFLGAQGTTWKSLYWNPVENATFRFVTHSPTQFVAIGDAGLNWTSTDGLNWVKRSNTPTSHFGLAYGNGKFVTVGFRGSLMVSTDGINWTKKTSGVTSNFNKIVYAADKNWFVGGSGDGQVSYSKDGGTTFTGTIIPGGSVNGIAYGNGMFVAAGGNGKVYTSTDAVTWTSRSVGSYHLFPTLFANGTFVVAGKNGYIYSSSDGINWTNRKVVANAYFLGGSWTGTRFIVVGEVLAGNAVMYTSTDGITWTKRTSKSKTLILSTDAKTSTGRVVGMGVWGSIIFSDNSTKTITITNPYQPASAKTKISFPKNAPTDITWTSSGGVGNVMIEYSTAGGGGPFTTIAASVPAADGKYTWNVPDITQSNCVIRISELDGDPLMLSAPFIIGSGEGGTLTVVSPNGGENLKQGSTVGIKWTSTEVTAKIRIRYSWNNGTDWIMIADNLVDDGAWDWKVPSDVSSSSCLVRINAINSSGLPYDVSNSKFSITSNGGTTVGVNVTAPNGGENLIGGGNQKVSWQSVGTVASVDIHFSTDGGINYSSVASGLSDSGSYSWTVPNIATTKGKILVRVFGSDNSSISDSSNNTFTVVQGNTGPPEIELDRNKLIFGAIRNGATPNAQIVTLTNAGGNTLNWTAASNASWLTVSPASGSGDAELAISANQSGLASGDYSGTITISDAKASNSPQSIDVSLKVINSSQDQKPFGTFATPEDGATIRSSVAVTGWALDDVELESVKLYREINGGLSYIGEAVFVEGARPDVEDAYPSHPQNTRAGWGYMLLTNFLPDGVTVLTVIAKDSTGYEVVLGSKTVTIDNENATKPFGAIDSPGQGGEASGKVYRNNGWALTPNPNMVPKDGSTIQVYVDGIFQGTAIYDLYRSDIAEAFPNYINSQGAWAYLDLNTTGFKNGIHTIEWLVTDNANNKDGIGSRFFTIKNLGARSAGSAITPSKPAPFRPYGLSRSRLSKDFNLIVQDFSSPIKMSTGYDQDSGKEIFPAADGKINLTCKPLERIKITIDDNPQPGKYYSGYMKVGDQLRRLPIGSTIDHKAGVFYWQMGPGFIGQYQLVFFVTENGMTRKKEMNVNILPGTKK
jgi:Viral BACON domain